MRNLFGLNNKKSGQDHHIVSNIQIQNNYENKVSKISSVDQLSEIIIVALQIICESFDDRSLPPRLSKFTRSSLDVIKLSQRMLNGDVSKGTFESLKKNSVQEYSLRERPSVFITCMAYSHIAFREYSTGLFAFVSQKSTFEMCAVSTLMIVLYWFIYI
jgi:hypothetical protein